MDRVFYF